MQIVLDGKHIAVEVRRSGRARWARLEVHLHRGVRVVLPHLAPASDAEKLVRSKSRWLLRHLVRLERLAKIVPDRHFISGERLPYLGEELTLEVATGPAGVERGGGTLRVSTRHPKSVRAMLEKWYFDQAVPAISCRVAEMAGLHDIPIRGIRISRAKTRWGSCSSTGWININWRLMLAPPAILDYLIAHELSHVGHRDHSASFWARVAELHPTYADAERWLKRYGVSLVL